MGEREEEVMGGEVMGGEVMGEEEGEVMEEEGRDP